MKVQLLMAVLLLTSCNREAYEGMTLTPEADSLLRATLPSARKNVYRGPVHVTLQKGNNNNASSVDAGKLKAENAAFGPGSTATSASVGTPWWIFGLCVVGGGLLGGWLRGRFSFLS